MKAICSFLAAVFMMVYFTSCQKGIDWELPDSVLDSIEQIIPMFKVVQVDVASTPQDSIVRIFNTVMVNNQKKVVVSEVYPGVSTDTLNYTFSYNLQGQLININETSPQYPNLVFANTTFTWVGNRLSKVVFDTSGVFEQSVEFFYTTAGANTIITTKETPSYDINGPDYTYSYNRMMTVDADFLPIKDDYNSHTYFYQFGVPENHYDTAKITYNYVNNDLSSIIYASRRYDTSGAGGSITNIQKDTATDLYSRSNAGVNITDSLKKIYGKEVYAFMNFDMLSLYPIYPIYGNQLKYYYYFSPLNSATSSKRVWINGTFDAGQSHSNVQFKKIVNSFDGQQRLLTSDVYQDFINTDVEQVVKITYY